MTADVELVITRSMIGYLTLPAYTSKLTPKHLNNKTYNWPWLRMNIYLHKKMSRDCIKFILKLNRSTKGPGLALQKTGK